MVKMDFNLVLRLLDSESPFTWRMEDDVDTCSMYIIEWARHRLSERNNKCLVHHITSYIGLSFHYFRAEHLNEAKEVLKIAEEKFEELKKREELNWLHNAIQHILQATKAYLLLAENNEEAIKAVSEISEVCDMGDKTEAAIYGLKSFIYENYNLLRALDFINEAIEIDPNESLWYFKKGTYLSNIRSIRNPDHIPGSMEVELLEKAVTIDRNVSYLLFIAQDYRLTASRIYRHHYPNMSAALTDQVHKLNEQSLKLYKESSDLITNNTDQLFDCARGLFVLPHRYRDNELAKQILKKAIELDPDSPFGNHVMAQYYERVEKDLPSAIERLKIAEMKKEFWAVNDRMRLEYRMNPDIDKLISELKQFYDEYPDYHHKRAILSNLISIYILKKTDLLNACECFKKILHLRPDCQNFTRHEPIFLSKKKIDLYDLVIDEIQIALENQACSSSDRDIYNELLNKFRDAGISVQPQPVYLKNKILNAFEYDHLDYKKKEPRNLPSELTSSFQESDRNIRDREKESHFMKIEGDGTDSASNNVYQAWRTYGQEVNRQSDDRYSRGKSFNYNFQNFRRNPNYIEKQFEKRNSRDQNMKSWRKTLPNASAEIKNTDKIENRELE